MVVQTLDEKKQKDCPHKLVKKNTLNNKWYCSECGLEFMPVIYGIPSVSKVVGLDDLGKKKKKE